MNECERECKRVATEACPDVIRVRGLPRNSNSWQNAQGEDRVPLVRDIM